MKLEIRPFLSRINNYQVFFLDMIKMCIAISTCVILFDYWQTYDLKVSQLKNKRAQHLKIQSDQQAYEEVFDFVASEHATKIFKEENPETFPVLLKHIAEESGLESLTYSFKKTSLFDSLFEDAFIQKNQGVITCTSLTDRAIFRFLDTLQNHFPGLVLIEKVHIKRHHDTPKTAQHLTANITFYVLNRFKEVGL